MIRGLSILTLFGVLSGCATAPRPLQGEFLAVDPINGTHHVGAPVRWGGTIAGVEPGAGHTCFQIVGRPLGPSARPVDTDQTNGRFLACREGFYDPAVFVEGRELTVTGRIDGVEDREIGAYLYRHPRVDAERIYLWPERRDTVIHAPGYRPWYW